MSAARRGSVRLRVDDGRGGALVLTVGADGALATVEPGAVADVVLGAADLRHLADVATIAARELDRIAEVTP